MSIFIWNAIPLRGAAYLAYTAADPDAATTELQKLIDDERG